MTHINNKIVIISILILLILILPACSPKEIVKEEKPKIGELCKQLSDRAVQDCSKNKNWQVLQEGMSYLGNRECEPAILETTTYREEVPFTDILPVEQEVVLTADEAIWNEVFCSNNPSSALNNMITENKVKLEKKVPLK